MASLRYPPLSKEEEVAVPLVALRETGHELQDTRETCEASAQLSITSDSTNQPHVSRSLTPLQLASKIRNQVLGLSVASTIFRAGFVAPINHR